MFGIIAPLDQVILSGCGCSGPPFPTSAEQTQRAEAGGEERLQEQPR